MNTQTLPPIEKRVATHVTPHALRGQAIAPNWRIEIAPEAERVLNKAIRTAAIEVSGLAVLESDQLPDFATPHTFSVAYAEVLSDDDTGSTTEISPMRRMQFFRRIRNMGFTANHAKVWWHKHPCNTWSGTDWNTRRERVNAGGEKVWSLAMVYTPRGWLGAFDMGNPDYHADIPVKGGTGSIERYVDLIYSPQTLSHASALAYDDDICYAPAYVLDATGYRDDTLIDCPGFGGKTPFRVCRSCSFSGHCYGMDMYAAEVARWRSR
jgi:hypothetical protein